MQIPDYNAPDGERPDLVSPADAKIIAQYHEDLATRAQARADHHYKAAAAYYLRAKESRRG